MPRRAFEPSIPTRSAKVPSGADCLHEIKHGGYRLKLQSRSAMLRDLLLAHAAPFTSPQEARLCFAAPRFMCEMWHLEVTATIGGAAFH